MKVKRMAKRLFAVGTGALMLGATAMGALGAVDLKDYPSMFVKDGNFNGYFVVGASSSALDNLAMTDIVAGMQYLKPTAASTTTVSGDAWKVGTSVKKLEMANSNAAVSSISGEQFYSIQQMIGKDELKALADGTYNTGDGQYAYQQFLYFDPGNVNTNEIVKYAEDDEDKVADFVFFQSGKNISKYMLEFTSPAQSDITDSAGSSLATGTYLDDFENTKLNMLGKEYTVVMARRPTATSGNGDVKFVLMSGAVKDSLLEGEEKTFTIDGKEYKVKLTYTDSTYAKFTVNGEATDKLQVGETKKLADGKEIGVSEVLYQSYAGGVHSATFFLGAGKVELKDDNIGETTDTSDYAVIKGGSDDIDGTQVFIHGSNSSSTIKLNSIRVDTVAQDDYFVPANSKLSDAITANNDDPLMLFTGNWDVEYKGLSSEKTHDIKLSTSSDRKYKLIWYDGSNNKVDMPLAYANTSTNLTMSEDAGEKAMIVNESVAINKNDYFVITGGTASSGTAKSYLLQYKGADKSTATSPKIKFKDIGSGDSLEYSVATSGTTATIKLGGYSFKVQNLSAITSNDFTINVALNGDDDFTDGGTPINVVDYYGAQIEFPVVGSNPLGRLACMGGIILNITTPYTSDYNDRAPSDIGIFIGATTTNKVALSTLLIGGTSNPLVNPSGEENMYYGYTSMGAKMTYSTPSSSPYEFTYAYPENQRLPQVYVTSGATTSSTAAGDWTKVTIVDATKLDTEIADYKAQNLIVVGGPCVNTVAAALLGNPAACTDGFTQGKARIKLFENGEKVAMLVAGYSGEDTRLAGKVIANRWKELTGAEMEVEGTTAADAKLSAPTPKAATPATTQ